jgi:hypothetical protein
MLKRFVRDGYVSLVVASVGFYSHSGLGGVENIYIKAWGSGKRGFWRVGGRVQKQSVHCRELAQRTNERIGNPGTVTKATMPKQLVCVVSGH